MNRRKSRILALNILFQREYQTSDMKKALNYFINHPDYKDKYSERHIEFALEILKGVESHEEKIDQVIESISENWTVKRMPLIDLNIIRIAVFEILHKPDIPRKTSIDEAVELAKTFGGENTASFVNGVLDKVSIDKL